MSAYVIKHTTATLAGMDLETLRNYCNSLPHVTEDVKWGNDLCLLIGGKMFCVTGFNAPLTVSLKVTDEEFEELSVRDGIIPAPYLARYKWVYIKNEKVFNKKDWEYYIRQSYELVKAKLPKKILKGLG
ncbi:MAG: MmcQ/YjbR family DNA-binding protein [Chitinophagales bacterium]|nr:MmcQ/YjbR family DNA-binding protein [Chitinophagales bacterium]